MAADSDTDLATQIKFAHVRDELQRTWSKLTEADIDSVNSDFNQLAELLHTKYGLDPVEVRRRLDEISADFRRDLTQEPRSTALGDERDQVRGTLRDQFRQF